MAVLESLREKLRYKLIWIDGAYRYQNPDNDLPADWETSRESRYLQLGLPLKATDFIKKLKNTLHLNLQNLNDTMPHNKNIKILDKNNGHIKVTPLKAQPLPLLIDTLQREINRRWSTINLIDILKEADFRVNFTRQFYSVGNRDILDGDLLQKRLLLCLYALGSNTGLKRVSAAKEDASHSDLSSALKTGTVDPDVLIKKFSKENYNHPVYKTLIEIGHAVKTISLCRYLSSEDLCVEINESQNVVERLNGIMGFIFYGKLGEISTNRTKEQALAVSCLHLLQVCMVYINTLTGLTQNSEVEADLVFNEGV
ncbi:MAG: hypothetical protein EBY22_09350, partial [Gammaproteobacteria bacterium]|nr:hypothetical protein [Gammaproteobacteria bacterium]